MKPLLNSLSFASLALTMCWATIARGDDTIASLYAEAVKEGKVVVWSPLEVTLQEKMAVAFARRYPGIIVEAFRIQPGPAIERAVTERNAGRTTVDIIDPNVSYLPLLFERGLVEPYPWAKVFGIPPEQLMFDSRAIVICEYDYPISFNTNLVQPGELKSWNDLLNPRWRGKIAVEARGLQFSILSQKWGEAPTISFVKNLLNQKPILTKGATPAAEALASGQVAVAVGPMGSRMTQFHEEGGPVEWARVGPIPALVVTIVPIRGGPHPNAARLWAAFWATEEAQKIFYDDGRYGMLTTGTINPRGAQVREAGAEVIRETTDIVEGQRLLELFGKMISGIP